MDRDDFAFLLLQETRGTGVEVLSNIKWENTTYNESHFIQDSKEYIQSADYCLDDIINIQK